MAQVPAYSSFLGLNMPQAITAQPNLFERWAPPPGHPLCGLVGEIVVRKRMGYSRERGSWALRRLVRVAEICLPAFLVGKTKVDRVEELIYGANYGNHNGLMQQSVGFHQAPNPGAGITTRIINIALVALHDSNHELNRYTLQPTLVHELSHIYFGHHGFDHHYYDWFLNIAVQAMAIEHEHRWDEDRALSVNYVQGLDMIQQNVVLLCQQLPIPTDIAAHPVLYHRLAMMWLGHLGMINACNWDMLKEWKAYWTRHPYDDNVPSAFFHQNEPHLQLHNPELAIQEAYSYPGMDFSGMAMPLRWHCQGFRDP